ncbi:sortase [Candidatus Gracilibacteria bacterium]|nr:sortase [Candidatus Gracilibacteria bacterium]
MEISRPHLAKPLPSRHNRLRFTLGNLFMFAGVYLLLYVGGIYAQIEYLRYAARGDTNVEAPRVVMRRPPASTVSTNARPQPTIASLPQRERIVSAPASAVTSGQIATEPPDPVRAVHISTVERVVIPSVAIDSKVIEVGWVVEEHDGRQVAVWEVAEYAVGQHRGSANPGEGENIVLAGHVGGYGQVFRDLYYVRPGEEITLYSAGEAYRYVISERLVLDEENAPPEQRAANAKLIGPTGDEMVTLVTCWPPTGNEKFTRRVIVRAFPAP